MKKILYILLMGVSIASIAQTPSTPNTTFTTTFNCGSTVVARTTSPPAGTEWYWQTSASGTSTALGTGTSINRTTSGNLYLRARRTSSPLNWSTNSQSVGNVVVYTTTPATPSSSTNASCFYGNTTALSVSTVSGTTGYNWYDQSSGGTPIPGANTNTYYPVTLVSKTYYVSSVNGGCESVGRKQVTLTVEPAPIITSANGDGSLNMGNQVTLVVSNPYTTYSWRNAANAKLGTGATFTTSIPGSYRVVVTKTGVADSVVSASYNVTVGPFNQALNFIVSNNVQVSGVNYTGMVDQLNAFGKSQSIQYFDGLGRPSQIVSTQASPLRHDIIVPMTYDNFGRETIKYLPYADGSSGSFKTNALRSTTGTYENSAQYNFYNGQSTNVAIDAYPFAVSVPETGPLNRIIKQGSAGLDWQPDAVNTYQSTDHTVKSLQDVNSSTEVLFWTYTAGTGDYLGLVNAGTASSPIYYGERQLLKKKTKDEHGNEVIEYTDKKGLIVLKRVQAKTSQTVSDVNYASTYYVYDKFDNLVCVLPPEAVSKLTTEYFHAAATDATKDGFLTRWAFRYRYDSRKRMTHKQVPGAGPVYMIYDKRDRLVFTQDGNQRSGSNKNWAFTKYDFLNRPVLTGILAADSVLTQVKMQRRVDQYYNNLGSTGAWFESYIGNSGTNVHGYDNKSYPVETNSNNYLTATYYDNYSFRSLWTGSYTYADENLSEVENGVTYNQPDNEFATVKGQVTGTKVKILDGGTNWLKSITYYDDNYRPIQVIADNQTGGTDRTTTVYNFVGKPLEVKSTHNALWRNHIGVSVSANSITKTLATTGWTNAGAASVKPLGAGQNGYIELTVSETTSTRMIGFSINDENQDYTTMDFSVYLNQTTLYAYERTINRGSKGTIATGDVIRLDRTGTSVKIYKNGSLLYTFPTSSATALYADCSLNSIGATLTGITLSWTPETHTVSRRMEYDHAGRLVNTWHQLDGNAEILLSKNVYNELGQLIDKKLHSTLSDGSNAKQSVDYRYNIRGWLTKINESDLNNSVEAGEARDLFGMELGYNTDIGVSNSLLYNGNISAIKWSNNLSLGDVKENAYTYSYDPMNRLTASAYKQKNGSWASAGNNGFAETGFTYDLNGNILTLQRNDGRTTGWMDNLTYNYGTGTTQSNKLLSVTDAGDDFKGFIDGTNSQAVNDYTYDPNGNMITDLNKNILVALPIIYNHLNLPEVINKGTSTVRYTYDATGRKLWQTVSGTGPQKQTDYLGEYVYTNGSLQFVNHEEGRIALAAEERIFSFDGSHQNGITKTGADVTLTNETNNGETYLKASITSGTTKRGISAFTSPIAVTPGDRYVYRVRGYRGGEAFALYVKGNSTDVVWPGAPLPNNINIEAWVETYFVVPPSVTQIELGVMLNTATTATQVCYVNEVQLIKLSNNSTAEYQYHLKDHLGNVRLTFTTKVDATTNTATLENANVTTEQSQFLRFAEARKIQSYLFDRTNGSAPSTTTGYAQRLNGTTNEKYGMGKSISVMPGDVIHASVYAKYIDPVNSNWTTALNTLLSQIAGGTAPAGTVVDGASYSNSTANFPFTGQAAQNTSNSSETGPKVYLNWLVFDRNYNFILAQSGYDRLSSAPKEAGQDVAHELLESPQITIKQPGYIYIYLSNEESTPLEAYFDDFTVEYTKSPVIQQDDYYAFGLTFNSYSRESSTPNQYKFNGIEDQDELGLNVSQAFFRIMDPTIGRWWQIDPKVDDYYQVTPYNMMGNNPINITDPLGDEWVDPKRDGKIAAQITKGVDEANALLRKKNDRLQSRIDKATAKGNTKKADALKAQKAGNSEMIAENNATKDKLVKMGDPNEKTKFTFKSTTGEKGGTEATGGVVVMTVLDALGNRAHEVEHGYNIGIRKKWDGEENSEIRAYRAQYAASQTGMPPSQGGTVNRISDITGSYVGGIMETVTNPDGTTTEKPLYNETYQKYKNSYKKK